MWPWFTWAPADGRSLSASSVRLTFHNNPVPSTLVCCGYELPDGTHKRMEEEERTEDRVIVYKPPEEEVMRFMMITRRGFYTTYDVEVEVLA